MGSGTTSFLRRGLLAASGPHAKSSRPVDGSVAARLGFLVQVVHDLAFTRAACALVQIAPSSRPDEREVRAASRALHVRCERVEPNGRLWQAVHSLAKCSRHAGQRLIAACWFRLLVHSPFTTVSPQALPHRRRQFFRSSARWKGKYYGSQPRRALGGRSLLIKRFTFGSVDESFENKRAVLNPGESAGRDR